ncbi:MAG: RNA polymerase sigma factor for flagellar operon FliA [Candidatus Magnetoglobus multicellularis str. Araruama]|uniref:RNA polymerase sigma factor n=1 Tax=Candidatus Magnetoglobus multicellularis str. Araruama TaxID=890399 RepID=A0A1V1P4Z0_9BACT|nr:MAG: RNA polymerase sigma factor for flagellar operon FliA [Candidatus Magnetoglobus multicellularis str. Araruama]
MPHFSEEEREQMVRQYAPLVKYIASRISMRVPPNVSLDDLISCGTMGLLDAISKFDPEKNVKFKTYAEVRIRGSILDGLRNLDWIPRSVRKKIQDMERCIQKIEQTLGRPAEDSEIAENLEINIEEYYTLLNQARSIDLLSLDETVRDQTFSDTKESYVSFIPSHVTPQDEILTAEVKQMVSEGIKKLSEKEQKVIALYYHEGLTLKEIGDVLGLTESRISQIHTQCVIKLRVKLKNYFE